jgi:hypothetical protein
MTSQYKSKEKEYPALSISKAMCYFFVKNNTIKVLNNMFISGGNHRYYRLTTYVINIPCETVPLLWSKSLSANANGDGYGIHILGI